MMELAVFIPITAIAATAWIIAIAIKTRHSAALQRSGATGEDSLDSTRQIELLSSENAGLKGQVGRLEERIAVLERIATDPAERTAREIDNLR
jgi:hypothetical protein